MRSLLAALVTVLVAASAVRGQSGPGTEGPPVTRIPPSVRSAGMAGAGVALVGDAAGVFVNPAAVATISPIGVEAGYQRLPLDAQVASAALAVGAGQFTVGLGAQALTFGDEPVVVGGLETGQSIRPWEGSAVGALVYRLGMLAVGAGGKYLRQSVGDVVNDGYAGDLGLTLAVFDIMALGVAMLNVAGGDIGAAGELPRTTRLGFTLNYVDPQGALRFLSTIEGVWATERAGRLLLGIEGGLVVYGVGVEVRGGLGSSTSQNQLSDLTFGGSLRVGGFTVDYAYQDADVLGAPAHRFGLRWTP